MHGTVVYIVVNYSKSLMYPLPILIYLIPLHSRRRCGDGDLL